MESAAEVVLEVAPIEGYEKSNGEAEATVTHFAGLVRTLREHVQFDAGAEVPATNPIIAWTVEHGDTMLSFYSDGLTPCNRMKGRPWHIVLAPSGERVEFRRRT